MVRCVSKATEPVPFYHIPWGSFDSLTTRRKTRFKLPSDRFTQDRSYSELFLPQPDTKALEADTYQGGTIKGSINLPAQTLYNSLPTLLDLCKNAGIISVIWYCGGSRGYQDIGFFCSQLAPELGSSRGRGTRAAGWFDDLLRERSISNMESVILLDGVAGWAKAGEEYTALMDDYDAVAWEEKK